jgi:DNA topoisomerase-3
VFEKGLHYVCEHAVGTQRSCDFRSGKIILQQEISNEQMSKLLADGRTDLLADFVSQRTRRKFKAFLVRDTDGKIGFEFAPRPERPGRPAAAARDSAPTDEKPSLKPSLKPAKKPAKKAAKSATTKAASVKAPAKKSAAPKAPAKSTPSNG